MKVNLVFQKDNWILERSAKEIVKYLDVTENKKDNPVNYFINYAQWKPNNGVSIALFTHQEERGATRYLFEQCAREVDFCIAMCAKTADILENVGARNISTLYMGVPTKKKLCFGVVGRTYNSGRKGEYLIKNMVDNGYDVLYWGKGWDGKEFKGTREDFYKEIDYLVVPSLNEGGPIPVIEALSHGVPVIAPDVGWCWEYSVIKYDVGNWDSLLKVLNGLEPPTWKEWALGHKEVFDNALRLCFSK